MMASRQWRSPTAAALHLAAFFILMTSSLTHSSLDDESIIPIPHDGKFPIATLSNGLELPLVGLGCASGVRREHVRSALVDGGYRHVDTAQSYAWGYREDEVGDGMRDAITGGGADEPAALDRDDIFVQSKIHPEDLGYDATLRVFQQSLERLHVSYVDSMLIHKPRCWQGACQREPEGTWQDSWRALEGLYDDGKVKALGICDVDDRLMNELMTKRVKPHIIQNWMDPFHQDKRMRDRCKREGVQYQAYSTLGSQWAHHRGHRRNPVLNDPTLQSIALAHDRTVAQVVINWATRHGVAVVPASTNPGRQRSNLNSFDFDLTDDDMRAIDALDGTLKAPEVDASEVAVAFENRGGARLNSFWVGDGDEEVPVGHIDAGGSLSLTSYHGHSFVFRDGTTGELRGRHTVERDGGLRQRHVVHGGDAEL